MNNKEETKRLIDLIIESFAKSNTPSFEIGITLYKDYVLRIARYVRVNNSIHIDVMRGSGFNLIRLVIKYPFINIKEIYEFNYSQGLGKPSTESRFYEILDWYCFNYKRLNLSLQEILIEVT